MKRIVHLVMTIMMFVAMHPTHAQSHGQTTSQTSSGEFKTFEEFMKQPAMPVDPNRVISMPFAQRDTLQRMTTAEAVGLIKFLLTQNTSQYKLVPNGPNIIPFEKGVITLYLDDNHKFHGSITPLKYMMLQNHPNAKKFLLNSVSTTSTESTISTVEF